MFHEDTGDVSNAANNNQGIIGHDVKIMDSKVIESYRAAFNRSPSVTVIQNVPPDTTGFHGPLLGEQENQPISNYENLTMNEISRLKSELTEERHCRIEMESQLKRLQSEKEDWYREKNKAEKFSDDVERLLKELFLAIKRVEKIYLGLERAKLDPGGKGRESINNIRDTEVNTVAVNLHKVYQGLLLRVSSNSAYRPEVADAWRRRLLTTKDVTTKINEVDGTKKLDFLLQQIFRLGFDVSEGSSEAEVVLAIMSHGSSTGKSSFIRQLMGASTTSETAKINEYHYKTDWRTLKLIDIPCFDNPEKGVTDSFVLGRFAEFLDTKDGQRLTGIIFLHPITDTAGGAFAQNLKMFRAICGPRGLKNVAIVTTKWDILNEETEGLRREAELKNDPRIFKPFVKDGVRFLRHTGSTKSARWIVDHVAQAFHKDPITLRIRQELDYGSLEDTAAGMLLDHEITQLEKKHEEENQKLKDEIKSAIAENDKKWKIKKENQEKTLTEQIAQLTAAATLLGKKWRLAREEFPPKGNDRSVRNLDRRCDALVSGIQSVEDSYRKKAEKKGTS